MTSYEKALIEQGGMDLHSHSFASDGQFKPKELAKRAESAGLEILALTDHDTVAGVEEFMSAGQNLSLTTVPGVEISCQSGKKRFHILGYYIDWTRPKLKKRLNFFEQARADRVRRMLEVLARHTGIKISFDEVSRRAGKSLIGKPHVAQTLVAKGVVNSTAEAFNQYLAHGRPLDKVPKERMGVNEAIGLIKESGGVPVLAHPVLHEGKLDLKRLIGLGIEGLEVFYSDNQAEDSAHYWKLARKHDLIVTGGSDFHGSVKPEVKLGDIRVDSDFLQPLKQASRRAGGRLDIQ